MRRLAALIAMTLLAAGCGAGAGEKATDVKLTVTENFGRDTVFDQGADVQGDDTVMRLLQRNTKVTTKYGGGFVQSIDGKAGGREDGAPVDWFFFVNGILAEKGASSVDVHPGARVWWDRHDWTATNRTPAVVGSYPEPFLNGYDGERLSTRLECADDQQKACDAIAEKLGKLGIVAGRSRIGTEKGEKSVRILVGTWKEVRGDLAAEQLEQGPKVSGVYAQPSKDGRTITALDVKGKAAKELGAGVGLIAATRWRADDPVWLVTGTDTAGVETAATQAFDESVLHEQFALAVEDGLPVSLPVAEDAGRP
jgi:hypothetical protein